MTLTAATHQHPRVFGLKTEITIRPITVCSADTPSASLLLTFPQARYLFNCPENTSRSFVQARTPSKHLSAIFLASPSVDHSAGLHGFLSGLADCQREKLLRVVGPYGTRYMMASGRLYTRREGMAVDMSEFSHKNGLERVYQDDHISVYATQSYQPLSSGSKRPLGTTHSPPSVNKRQKTSSLNGEEKEIAPECLNDEAMCASSKQEQGPSSWLDSVVQDMFRPSVGAHRHSTGPRLNPTPAYSYKKLDPPTDPIILEPSSYLVVGPKLQGKFLPDKAKALGVKPGPDFARLVKGENVMLDDGKTVESQMCVDGGSDGSSFYISNVASLQQLHRTTMPLPQQMVKLGEGAQVAAVFHFVGPEVLSDPRYLEWLSQFGTQTKHYLSSPSHSRDLYSFEASVLLQLKLSLVSASFFPIPHYDLHSLDSFTIPDLSHLDRFQDIQINFGLPQAPRLDRLDYDLVKCPGVQSETIQKLGLDDKFLEILDHIRQAGQDVEESVSDTFADRIIVTTLGTGSAVPSKYRNGWLALSGKAYVIDTVAIYSCVSPTGSVSATLLHIPYDEQDDLAGFYYVLLDAGEGTLGQIKRSFGKGWQDVLRAMKLIFISHLHADHHAGLASLLIERNRLSDVTALVLVCQYGVNLYLQERSLIEPMGLDGSSVLWVNVEKLVGTLAPNQAHQFGFDNILPAGMELEAVRVIHWGKCYGICISHHTQAWKIVFSGDTKYCADLIKAGLGADLLIHEASLGVEEKSLAETKGHCTIDQAIAVGLEMKVRNCILNHFSSRYPKIPRLPHQTDLDRPRMNIGISFDLMTCRIGEIFKLESYLPAFEYLCKDPDKEEAKTEGKVGRRRDVGKQESQLKDQSCASFLVEVGNGDKVGKCRQKNHQKSGNLGTGTPKQSVTAKVGSVAVLTGSGECNKVQDQNL